MDNYFNLYWDEWDGIDRHAHQCRSCPNTIDCTQSDEECDRNGGIGQYNGQCDDCNRKERVAALVKRMS